MIGVIIPLGLRSGQYSGSGVCQEGGSTERSDARNAIEGIASALREPNGSYTNFFTPDNGIILRSNNYE